MPAEETDIVVFRMRLRPTEAQEALLYRNCAGSFSRAVCVASRAMLMTGRYWMNLPAKTMHSTGVYYISARRTPNVWQHCR